MNASAHGHLFQLLISARVFCNHGCTGYFCKSLFCWNVKYVKSFFRCCHCICWSVVILLHPFLRVVQVVGAAHPTTTMAAQPKRARGAAAPRQSMLKSINAHVEAVQSGATAQTIKNIVAYLDGEARARRTGLDCFDLKLFLRSPPLWFQKRSLFQRQGHRLVY